MPVYMRVRNAFLILCILLLLPVTPSEAKDNRLHTVVLDPGHGGKDPGAVSRDKKTYEKTIVLEIAKLLGKKIEDEYGDEVKVYYTRDKDVFIPLQTRADFANSKGADLFISIHIDASPRGSAASGHSSHVLGASSNPNRDVISGNLDVCKRENSVILLEEDYTTTYQGFDPSDESTYIFMTLMQGAFYEQSIYFASLCEREMSKGPIAVSKGVQQHAFYVLWKTSMPSVLLELGFITNDSDLAKLRTGEGREQIASKIFGAFKEYKVNYDSSMDYGN